MSGIDKFQIDRHQAVLLVVDVQQKLVPAFPESVYSKTLQSIDILVKGAKELKIPTAVTEQYPKGLGNTVPELADASSDTVIEKMSFGCCGELTFMERLHQLGRSEIIVTGVEAHVCVYQTVLGLLDAGYRVHLVRDAICSRHKQDFLNAVELARSAGAVVSTAETVLFQLLQTAAAPEFKAISKLIRSR
ncbi:MAG: hydrolase [Desulfuromonas sp.]|nr:MAG: hydrolase [Desulfuromonas sp.]